MCRKNRCLVASALIATACIAGCGKSDSAQEVVKRPMPRPPLSAPSAPAAPAPIPVQAQASSSKAAITIMTVAPINADIGQDPFKSFLPKTRLTPLAVQGRPVINPEDIPIARFEVAQFRVLGIITGDEEGRAMVEDPDRKAYVVRVGSRIGCNNGHITGIANRKITVSETVTDGIRKTKRTVPLSLPKAL